MITYITCVSTIEIPMRLKRPSFVTAEGGRTSDPEDDGTSKGTFSGLRKNRNMKDQRYYK